MEIRVSKVMEEIKVGNDIVFVEVEIPVCSTCGERYYGRASIRSLEDLEKQLKQGHSGLREVGKVMVYR